MADKCSVALCGRETLAKGFCSAHYERNRRGADITTPVRGFHSGCSVEGCGRKPLTGLAAQESRGAWVTIRQHSLVMETAEPFGRTKLNGYLKVRSELEHRSVHSWENVHHKNGIRDDNRIENLEVWVKPQPTGARLDDLISFIVDNYPEAVDAARSGRPQLRLIVNREAV